MSIQDEIMNTVEIIVQKYLSKLKIPRDVVSVVTEISGDKCKVNIDGINYWVKDGIGLNLTVGTAVWIRIIGNERYISSRK